MKTVVHTYRPTMRWTGNLGTGTSAYRAYARDHEIAGEDKAVPIPCSSDAAFRGDPAKYSPEDLLVGSLSACHMLWMLHLCAERGIVILEYEDRPIGTMVEHPDGSGEFTLVVLHPRLTIADPSRLDEASALHRRAHERCFIARSVNFEVRCEPEVPA